MRSHLLFLILPFSIASSILPRLSPLAPASVRSYRRGFISSAEAGGVEGAEVSSAPTEGAESAAAKEGHPLGESDPADLDDLSMDDLYLDYDSYNNDGLYHNYDDLYPDDWIDYITDRRRSLFTEGAGSAAAKEGHPFGESDPADDLSMDDLHLDDDSYNNDGLYTDDWYDHITERRRSLFTEGVAKDAHIEGDEGPSAYTGEGRREA